LKAGTGRLFPKTFAERTRLGNLLVADQDYMLMKPNSVNHTNPKREKKYERKIQH
jgi:hypothetical protein